MSRSPRERRFTAVAAAALIALALPLLAQGPPESNSDRLLRTRECRECDLSNAKDLTGKDLSGVDLTGANLAGAMLYRTNFTGATLTSVNFADANLTRAVMTDAKLDAANLAGANLTSATGANFAGATSNSLTTCPSGAAGPCS